MGVSFPGRERNPYCRVDGLPAMALSTDTILVGIALLVYDAGFNRWATAFTAAGFALVALGYAGSLYRRASGDD
ncbi:hypothetical protein JCM18549_11340 [Halolamina salina]